MIHALRSPLTGAVLALASLAPLVHFASLVRSPQDPRPTVIPAQSDAKAKETAVVDAEKEKEGKVRELLQLLGAEKQAETAMAQMIDMFRAMPNLPEGFLDKFAELAKPTEVVELSVPVYMKHIDPKDLDAALAYFRSEPGRRWAAAQGPILSETMKAGQEWGQKLAMRVMRELQGK